MHENSPSPDRRLRVSRRTLTRGAAWAAPVVATAAAAPAYAASPTRKLDAYLFINWGGAIPRNRNFTCGNNQYSFDLTTTLHASNTITLTNTSANTTLSDLSITFYLYYGGTTPVWTKDTGMTQTSSNCWSGPVASGTTRSVGGRTAVGYTITFTCPLKAPTNGGTWTLPTSQRLYMTTQCLNGIGSSASYDITMKVNGAPVTNTYTFAL